MAEIRLTELSKHFGGADGVRAVDAVDLEIRDGEFMVLVGPSGCGKTTLLRLIAGLEEATQGTIHIGERDVTELPPRRRDIAMVFQNYALYPHMSVRENLVYGLRVRRTTRSQRAQRVRDVAALLGLEELLERRPAELSGGQRQRVAIGRAIVREPQAFLMDEPLSNLDAKLRVAMRAELSRLHDRLGTTTVFVTHDQVEAMTLGERVAVMRGGRVQQLDRPQELYARPVNLFVAAFIGSPSMNLAHAEVQGRTLTFGGWRFRLPYELPVSRVIVGIRPEVFEDGAFANASLPRVSVDVAVVEELGPETHIIFPIDAQRVETEETRQASDGEEAALLADDERVMFTAKVDPRSSARRGSPMQLALDPSRLHFFDATTGARVTPGASARLVATAS